MNKKIRKIMNSSELQKDNLWYEIMASYIPDDYTDIEIQQTADLYYVILAVNFHGNYFNNLSIYYGENFYQTFLKSGYMEDLLDQDDDYLESMFNDEQIELIKEEKNKGLNA